MVRKFNKGLNGSSKPEPEKSSFSVDDLNINGKNPEGTIKVEIDGVSIRIVDSYKIKSRIDQEAILRIIMDTDEYKNLGYTRSLESYLIEWQVHNRAFKYGILPDSSRSVDIDKSFDLSDSRQAAQAFLYWLIFSVRTL